MGSQSAHRRGKPVRRDAERSHPPVQQHTVARPARAIQAASPVAPPASPPASNLPVPANPPANGYAPASPPAANGHIPASPPAANGHAPAPADNSPASLAAGPAARLDAPPVVKPVVPPAGPALVPPPAPAGRPAPEPAASWPPASVAARAAQRAESPPPAAVAPPPASPHPRHTGQHVPTPPSELTPLLESLRDLFVQDRANGARADATRCGICYLTFPRDELTYFEQAGYYACRACAAATAAHQLTMVRRQRKQGTP